MMRQFTFFFLLSFFTFVVNAEDEIRYYNVEVILFEHTNPANQHTEDWTPPKQGGGTSNDSEQAELIHQLGRPYMMDAESPYDPQLMFTIIPAEEYQLLKEAKKIEESTSRRMLMHTAWRQPGLSKEQAVRVHFKQLIDNKNNSESATASAQTLLNASPTPVMINTPYLEGSIKVMLARYLHVDTNILYYTQVPAEEEITTTETAAENFSNHEYIEISNQLTVYQMKQLRRRIRSKELHYLDHPVLGLLLVITPYEKPEITKQVNTAPKGYKTLP